MAPKDSKDETITLTGGEDRREKNVSVKTYHVLVTPTGQEMFLSQTEMTKGFLLKSYSRRPTYNPHVRSFEETYIVKKPCLLKTFSIVSALGNLAKVANLFIEVDGKSDLITYTGWMGFGSFTGRGTLVKELTEVVHPHLGKSLEFDLAEDFGFRILAPAIGNGGKFCRAQKDPFHRNLLI